MDRAAHRPDNCREPNGLFRHELMDSRRHPGGHSLACFTCNIFDILPSIFEEQISCSHDLKLKPATHNGTGSSPLRSWTSTTNSGTCGSRRSATGRPDRATSPKLDSGRTATAPQHLQVRTVCQRLFKILLVARFQWSSNAPTPGEV